MSKQGQQGSNLIAQQGLAKSSSESTNFSESIKEHPSSSAPFEDKKDFFEKLSAQSDDQLQQGDVGQQGIREDGNINIQQGSSELKQSSGSSSDIKKGSTFTSQQDSSSSDLKEGSTGKSDVKQESFKEHPSSSAPFEDKKEFFEKLSAQSDDQLQQGNVGQQGIKEDGNINIQQGSSSELKKSSGSSSDIKKGSTYTSQQDSSSSDLKEGSTGKSDVKQESFKEHPSSSAPFEDKKEFFEKLSAQSDDQLQQGDVEQSMKNDNTTQQGSSSELKQSSGSSSDIKKGSTFTSQQGSSSNEWKEGSTGTSDVKQESFKEHPSSSAPFGDKKDFFEKLSAQSDDQLQQGDVGQQGIKNDITNTQQGSSSELKKSSGSSSDIKEGSTFTSQQDSSPDLKENSTGKSDVKQESFKEHPSSSAPFEDKKDFFEKLSAQSDDQLQQGDVGQQGIKEDGNTNTQQGSSFELKESSGSSSDIKKGSTYTSQQDSSSNEWKEGSTGTSDVDKDSFGEQDEGSSLEQHGLISQQGLNWQGPHETEHGKQQTNLGKSEDSSELKKSSGSSSDIKKGSTYTSQQDSSSNEWKEGSTGTSDVEKDSFGEQDKGSNFGNDEVKWQGPSDETEFNSFGNKVSSDLKQTSVTSEPKETSSDVKGTRTSKSEEGKRDSDLIDFGSETKQDKSSSEGGFDLSGEISNLKIDSSSSFGQSKKKSVETGPFYDDKVHDDRNDTK